MGTYTQVTEELYDYIVAKRTQADDHVLTNLLAKTRHMGQVGRMAVSPEQGSFLTFLAMAMGAELAIEVGTFTGSSSIYIARGLPATGHL